MRMDPLSISASITALLQLTSTVVQYLNSVKGASEDRRRILSELASVNGILFILQDQADQAKQGDKWSSTLQSLNVSEGPLDQFRRALERLSSKLAPPATGLKKLGNAIVWPFQKEEIKEILGSIERQKALFNLARQNDHIRLSKAIKDDVALLQSEVEQVAKGVRRLQLSQITNEHHRIIEWLDVPDPSTNYNRALKSRTPKTGSWFLESKAYADWINAPGSLLWLHGIPGCGKTVLSSTILENVLGQTHTKPDSAVLYFYFDFNDAEKQQSEKMIRSLICQLSMYCADSVLHNLYSSCSNGRRQPSGEILLNTLHLMMTSLGDIYVIFDALDECAERYELLTDLEEVVSWKDANVHLLTTSRRETDIEDALTPLSDKGNRVAIQSGRVNADIGTYVHGRLQIDRKLKRWQKYPDVQMEIENTLTRKADGMFRWVACQLDSLGDCFDLPHLRQALASLPKTLDDTYARILCNIDNYYSHYNRQILKILQWLTFSLRPLELKELGEIIAIEVDQIPRFDPQRRMPEPRDLLRICSSLITLTKNVNNASEVFSESSVRSQDPEDDGEAGTSVSEDIETYVRLAHFSVKEYLVSDRIQHGAAPYYSIREIESHGVLAEDCIAYLLQFDEPGSLTSVTLNLTPLAQYAADFWMKHAKSAEEGSIKSITLLGMELFMAQGGAFLDWIRIRKSYLYELTSDPGTPLYYASEAGLLELVRMLIEGGMDVNVRAGKYGYALQAASFSGEIKVVQLLIDNKADVKAQGGELGNALQAASSKGHIDVVHLLLANGADVNAQGGRYGNALQAAAFTDAENIMKLLLKHGANVNAEGGYYNTALIGASLNGSENAVKLLLEKGADVNVLGDGSRGSALYLASAWGHENIVKLLLEKGADINALGHGSMGSALQAASYYGYENIVKLLLEKGADINALGYGSMRSALQMASVNNYENIVKLLLEKGADVNIQIGSRGSVLQIASRNGHENIVKLLLEKGADVNILGGSWGSALQAALENNHENIVKLLLEKGADINALDRGLSALQAASNYGYENIVKLLLEKGADVNALGYGPMGSALQMASANGYENIMKLLLEKGADVNTQIESRGSVLQVASRSGYENIVKLLLEKGADVNALGGSWGSALQVASKNDHENIVKLLLEKGADVNALGDGFWGSALYAASENGHENIVKLLLEKGADVNALGDGFWGSALYAASENGHENIVKLLLEKGADVNALGDGSWGSALYIASENGHENVVKMLVAKGAVNVMPKEDGSEDESSEYESSEDERAENESPENESSGVERDGDTPTQWVGDAPAGPAVVQM